jgi:bifunctional UDP-N-acetylglucosamine pyrophosphorylase/glucosamine-1-phosphate N-acetyltransferase
MRSLSALVLAAGKGTRMVSSRAKVLHTVCGIPMLVMIYRAVAALSPDEIFVVVGQDADRVRSTLEGSPATFILQAEQLGTGHAAIMAREELQRRRDGDVIVLFGDTPRIRTETLARLAEIHRESGAATTLLTVRAPDPFGYGRIVRASDGGIEAIVEQKDATPEQRKITEINPGVYCFQVSPMLEALGGLTNDNAQGEYYITDLIALQRRAGLRVNAVLHDDYDELRGINSRRELADLAAALRRKKNTELMAAGVTMIDPDRTYIDLDVVLEKDVTLHPMVTLEGKTRIGEETTIRPGSRVTNSVVGRGVEILESSIIVDSQVGDRNVVGPCAHLRNGARVGDDCRIGDFVEIKSSTIGNRTSAAHLSYLGDATVGSDVTIGAGTITCNFDGRSKNATIIEDHALIGSDVQLVAPVRIGRGAVVAAGSCVTDDVPPGALAIARGRQVNKMDWAQRRNRSRNDQLS